ncbi:helix-turn-helix transcriptional regulator [Nocardia sp. NPDC127526]|uniref:helix-turn-helix transcriptional regulator n=1 Tax=Nocardia sp. NPDC127526 TaxID=3345393 RepID=UPI00362F5462
MSNLVWHRPEFWNRRGLLVNLAQVAAQYGVSPQAVHQWRQRHPSTFPKIVAEAPRLVYVVGTEVDEWVLNRELARAVPSKKRLAAVGAV